MTIAEPIAIERATPFPHLYSPGFLSPDLCHALYDYFETSDKWHLPEGAAPDDGPILFLNGLLPPELAALESDETIDRLKSWLAAIYDVEFGDYCEVIANKMLAGQGIRPHTDFHDDAPTYRIVIFVTRDWTWDHGGALWLLNSQGEAITRDGHVEYPPVAGDAITFGISPRSYHTVQTTTQGVRYSLTYSFYRPGHKPVFQTQS